MSILIREVISKQDTKAYIDFPHELYKNDKNYVPEIYMGQKDIFNKKKYPFFEYGEVRSFLAYRDQKIVGRISAIANHRYNEYHNCNIGFFGFFDVINDQHVADLLLDKVTEVLKEYHFDRILGPTNYSTNETAGVLIDGYDRPPMLMMTYNYPYYPTLLESYGYGKEMDLYAYMIYTNKASEKSLKLSNLLEERLQRQGITIRNLNLKKYRQEVAMLKEVYNAAWEKNWGFVPFTEAEFAHLAADLKMLADEKFAYIAEYKGKAVAFGISLPNINEITIDFKKGRLLPFNIFKLLLKKSKVRTVRILALGVTEGFRKKGIEAIFFAKNIAEARVRNLEGGEASWILESNAEMVQAAEKLNGERYKSYRIYSKSIK